MFAPMTKCAALEVWTASPVKSNECTNRLSNIIFRKNRVNSKNGAATLFRTLGGAGSKFYFGHVCVRNIIFANNKIHAKGMATAGGLSVHLNLRLEFGFYFQYCGQFNQA